MARPTKYPPELLDRGARVVIESGRPIAHVARDLGVPAETLRRYVRQVEADEGRRPDLPGRRPPTSQRAGGERSARAVEDERLLGRIQEVHAADYYAYGYPADVDGGSAEGRDGWPRPRQAADARARHSGRKAPRQAVAHDGSRSGG